MKYVVRNESDGRKYCSKEANLITFTTVSGGFRSQLTPRLSPQIRRTAHLRPDVTL